MVFMDVLSEGNDVFTSKHRGTGFAGPLVLPLEGLSGYAQRASDGGGQKGVPTVMVLTSV
jgi:uncharacterized membrane protein